MAGEDAPLPAAPVVDDVPVLVPVPVAALALAVPAAVVLKAESSATTRSEKVKGSGYAAA